jgi:arginine-tRNA-protein transferase
MVEYREPTANGEPGRLVGACLTDRQGDGLSMIYSFYDPDHEDRVGLGNTIILDHIQRAANSGLPYVYLGYWVDGSPRMQYKVRYRPLETLTRDGWRRMDSKEQTRLIAAATAPRDAKAGSISAARGKDGQPVKFPAS